MTNRNIRFWLLVVLAIVGLTLAIPVVSAYGADATADDAPPYNATSDEWATWMETEMNEHMGPGSVEWMESHMGVTVEEMSQDMTNENYNGTVMNENYNGTVMNENYNGGIYGQGHC